MIYFCRCQLPGPAKKREPFHTPAAQKVYEMPNLVVMSTDLPMLVSKTVEMSPAADVELEAGH
jgi:hypothetical protein